jgi:outer membrane protein insertion porin family
MSKLFVKSLKIIFFYLLLLSNSLSEIITDIKISGNQRISNETIILFSDIKKNNEVNNNDLNQILKNLYGTNFFKDISLEIKNRVLYINVIELPLIQSVKFEGLKAKKFVEPIKKVITLKDRSSFNENILLEDRKKISELLKSMGYYFATISTVVTDLDDNKINLIYNINTGERSKVSKITFTGNKIYKDNKLRSIIASEEYKFWKFISGKKYLNYELIKFDQNLLKNFYLNNGYYNAEINSSFARLLSDNEFELIFNIQANDKFFFNDLNIEMSNDYNQDNFQKIFDLFKNLKGEPYSINSIDKILELIDDIIIEEQFESIKASVKESVEGDKINLLFEIEETDKFFVERINILGNNITDEKVIRNQLEIDEGDPFNEILQNKSINNIKSLNFFKKVSSDVSDSENKNSKIVNITVEEKPTGEIMAGAGIGTSGSTVMFGVKENNFLGRGIGVNSQFSISEEDIKGNITVSNPNFKNSDKSVFFKVESSETDRLEDSGYKNSKNGFNIGTNFEYLDDLRLGIGTSNYYEKISTNSTASTAQQNQEGHYWDSFLNLNFTQDKRNQKFQASRGFISRYSLDLPIISDTNSFINEYSYKYYTELFNENVSSIGFSIGSAFSIDDSDIKLSERLFIPSGKLRGFETGKVGPKDNNDFIGGNYMATLNFSTTLPQILPNSQNLDTVFFVDVANLWGVDYDSSIDDKSKIKSSIGIGIDWFTMIGPLSFSLAQPITKDHFDVTETFRFNIGTTF